ncbi:beta strand repeat-containing protein, partial [Novipirellula sp.]|uniref:beta strand repeat-containing protein n=1 Tax=Novipirellula sp. TaxID=2795430 RepID=UPI0035644EE1
MSRKPRIESLEDRRLLAVVLHPTTGTANQAVVNGDQYFDSGNVGANYINNEDGVLTLNSGSGSVLQVDFTSFQLEPLAGGGGPANSFDFLQIFDGTTTGDPLVGAFESVTPNPPGTITASGSQLTFQFESDDSITRSGWEANVNVFAQDLIVGGTGGDDDITIGLNVAGQLEVMIGGTPANIAPFGMSPFDTTFLNSVTVAGGDGDDSLTIDFSNGNPIPAGGLRFDGDGQTTSDTLRVLGGNFTTITSSYTNANDGNIDLDGSVITYTGLEPVLLNVGTVADIVFNLPAGPNPDVLLADDGFGADPNGNTPNTSAIDGSTFEFTEFTNPTKSLTVNAGDNADTITVNALDPISPAGADPPVFLGSSRNAELFSIDTVTGAGSLIGLLPFAATEIETNPSTNESFEQLSGNLFIQQFDPQTGMGIGGTVFDGDEMSGLEFVGGILYGTGHRSNPGLYTVDPFTGATTFIGPSGVNQISGLAYDEAAMVMYGVAGGAGPSDLYTIDLTTGAATVVGNTGIQAGSIEFGPDGNLYAGVSGFGPNAGELYRIDPATGASTLVGDTGFTNITGLTLIPFPDLPGFDIVINSEGDTDEINISAVVATQTVTVNAGDGNDTVNVTSDAPLNTGNLDDIDGQVNVNTGGGIDTLNVSDQGDSDPDTYTLEANGNITQLSFGDGDAPVDIRYNVDEVGQLEFFNLITGSGGDTVNVLATTARDTTTIDMFDGNDANTMTINGDALSGNNIFHGGAGNDRFVLNIANDLGASAAFPLTSLEVHGDDNVPAGTAGDTNNRDSIEVNDNSFQNRSLTFDYLDSLNGDVDVSGFPILFPPITITQTEDDGALPLANPTGLTAGSPGTVKVPFGAAAIGDGPFGGTSGDYDWYQLSAAAGQLITVDLNAAGMPGGLPDSLIGIYNSSGTLVASTGNFGDSQLNFTAFANDTYYVVVSSLFNFQTDPFDPSSGLGAGSTGDYELLISLGRGPLQIRTMETVIYNGDQSAFNFAPDFVTVVGTSGDDDFTVAPLDSNSALVFRGGDPWDGPTEGSFFDQFPGIAGGSSGPDIQFNGLFNLTFDGGGSTPGGVDDRLYVYAPSEAPLIDAGTTIDPFDPGAIPNTFGLGPGVIVPGFGVGNAFDSLNISDGFVSGFNNSRGSLLGIGLVTNSFVQSDPLVEGLIVNSGIEANTSLPVTPNIDVADNISATLSFNFGIQVNGGDPDPNLSPADTIPPDGDRLFLATPGPINIYSDKTTPPVVSVSSNDPSSGVPTFGLAFSSIENTLLTPGNGVVNMIGDNNEASVSQTDNFVVVGQDIDQLYGTDAFQQDGGVGEFSLEINGSAPVFFNDVRFLNVYGDDQNPPPGVADPAVDTLEITPYADDTPRGWGIDVFFDEGDPSGVDGDQADLLILHTSLLGGQVSEDILIRPAGPDSGEIIVTNKSDGSLILDIDYVNNTDIIVIDDDGFTNDTDTLTLLGTNPDAAGTSGNETVIADFTAAGGALTPQISVRDGATVLYNVRSFAGFSTVNFSLLGGDDALNFTPDTGNANGLQSVTVNYDGGDPVASDTLVVNANASARVTQGAESTSGLVDQLGLGVGDVNFTNVE